MITVPSVFSALAASRRTAGLPAIAGREPVTFAELFDRARGRAAELRAHGVGRGDIVAIVAFNETSVFDHFIATGLLGAALMPLSPALSDRELVALVEKADAAACLVTPAAAAKVGCLDSTVRRVAVIGDPPKVSDDAALEFPSADSNAWISTTGGSTGTPRLFAMSHERLLTNVTLNALEWRWRDHGTQIAAAPLAHGIGFSQAIGQLAGGGSVTLVERYDPAAVVAAVRAAGAGWTAVVPTMLRDILHAAGGPLPELGLAVVAGAPMSLALRRRALEGRRLIEYYGSTELGWVSWVEHDAEDDRAGLVGWPTLGTTVRIVGPDGAPVADGVIGRVEKRGRPYAIPAAGGTSAYEANASAWESSGDVGSIGADGALVLAGREDDMIVVGGQNVYPVEVEAVLRDHPDVGEVLVRARPDERLGATLVAFVEPAAGAEPDVSEVTAYATERLAKFKRPRIELVDRLPRNASGKLARSIDPGVFDPTGPGAIAASAERRRP